MSTAVPSGKVTVEPPGMATYLTGVGAERAAPAKAENMRKTVDGFMFESYNLMW
jgi:hypothetical protein